MTAADIEAIASGVLELLRQESQIGDHVEAAAVAAMLRVSDDRVREHAVELGAVRIGDGPKGALRFDLRRVRAALERRRPRPIARTKPRRSGPDRRVRGVELLPLPNDG